jgi:hypothetical protein
MKKTFLLILTGVLFLIYGCANRLAPEWYRKLPADPNVLTVNFKATSDSLQLAIKMAEDGARRKLTEAVGLQIRDLRAKLEKEIKLNEQQDLLDFFNKRVKAVVTANLFKINVKKQHTINQEETWHTFIVMEYPLAAANKSLVDEFKRDAEMYERVRQSQSFLELEKQVELAFVREN